MDALDQAPEAVSSRFSVTETSATPRRRKSARMATWSSMFRARRSILWTTTTSTSLDAEDEGGEEGYRLVRLRDPEGNAIGITASAS